MKEPGKFGPLAGVVVIDMTQYQQGPVATMMLADMGAEVIKVEPRLTGDPGRYLGPVAKLNLSAYVEANDRGKKSITLDIRKEKGKEILYKLVEKADIFAENFRVGVAERRGFAYEDLRRINPSIIYLSSTAYGTKGPSAELPGFDAVGQAIGGIANVAGEEKDRMATLKTSVGDQTGAFLAAYGVMLALFHRQRTGEGQKVETSLIGGQITLMGWEMEKYLLAGVVPARSRGRITHGEVRPNVTGSFKTKDSKFIVIQATGKERYEHFFKLLGLENFLTDPRFDTAEHIEENSDAFHAPLDELFLTKDRDEWLEMLRDNDVVCAPINDFAEAASDPDVIANEYVTEIDHPKAGRIKVLGIPIKLSETPGRIGIAPELGQHTEETLKRWGYSSEVIAQLRREEVI